MFKTLRNAFKVKDIRDRILFTFSEKAKRMENMPKVAVLYVNNAETTYNDEVDGVVLGNLEKCINDDKYIYINGEPYIEKLNKVGIVDITTAERADIVDAFEGEDVDYVVFIEVQPSAQCSITRIVQINEPLFIAFPDDPDRAVIMNIGNIDINQFTQTHPAIQKQR